MWIPILIVLLVLAMAVGPVMWFRSTPSQLRTVKFRSRAAELGLRVQLSPLSELGVPGENAKLETVAAYGLPWVQRTEDDVQAIRRPSNRPWRLTKERMTHGVHFAGWWDWQEGKEADKKWHDALRSLLSELPGDVLALENNGQGLWVYWRERGDPERVDQIASILQRLRQIGLQP